MVKKYEHVKNKNHLKFLVVIIFFLTTLIFLPFSLGAIHLSGYGWERIGGSKTKMTKIADGCGCLKKLGW